MIEVLRHPRCGVEANSLTGARHDERDASPVRGRSAGVSCTVGQNNVPLAPAGLAIGLGAVVAD